MRQGAPLVDFEYERNGMASIFMSAEPPSGFRQATAEHAPKTIGLTRLLSY